MINIINTIPGYRIVEYQLVLNPHEELRNRIMQVKKQFFETCQSDSVLFGKPHIAIVNFAQYQMMEERLVNRLQTVAMGFHPIKVELKDYGSFPSHTIYIQITSKVPVQTLIKKIRTEAQQMMKLNDENKPHFMMEPYLAIGRKLQPWQYEKAWTEYQNKNFTGRFIADSMLLLKRPAGEMKYQVAHRLEFRNLPVTTKQGLLFT